MTTTVNLAADTGLPDERSEPNVQTIMELFCQWQALDERNTEVMTDEENEACAAEARKIVDRMKSAGPKTAAEMAAIIYSDTLGFQVYSEEEHCKYLLDVIEAEQQTKVADAFESWRILRKCLRARLRRVTATV